MNKNEGSIISEVRLNKKQRDGHETKFTVAFNIVIVPYTFLLFQESDIFFYKR